jgi:hypothetical protein
MGMIIGYLAMAVFAIVLASAWLLRRRSGGFDRAMLILALLPIAGGGIRLAIAMRGKPEATDLRMPAGVATGGILVLGFGVSAIACLGQRALWRRFAAGRRP